MKPVAVIILNWNGAALLRRYLPSVIANTNSTIADVIVADNGSTDESVKVLKEEFPEVKTLLFSENWGFAEGYNKCVAQTAYKYTVLLNSDVRTPEGWLEPLYEYMEAHSDVGAVQPKLLKDFGPDDPRQVFEYAGAAGGYIDKHGYPYCRGRIFGTVEEDHGQYDSEVTDIFWATGACFMVRSEVYLKVGGLDKDFFAHMEEIDLAGDCSTLATATATFPKARCITSVVAAFHKATHAKPTSTSATTCFFCTRICQQKTLRKRCSFAASTTRSHSSKALPASTSAMPRRLFARTTTSAPCASSTPNQPHAIC